MVATPPTQFFIRSEITTYCDKPIDITCPYSGYPELNYTWVFWRNWILQTEGKVKCIFY